MQGIMLDFETETLMTSFAVFNNIDIKLPQQDVSKRTTEMITLCRSDCSICILSKTCRASVLESNNLLFYQMLRITSSPFLTTKLLNCAFSPILFFSVDSTHHTFMFRYTYIILTLLFVLYIPSPLDVLISQYLIVVLRFLFLSFAPTFSLYKAVMWGKEK